LNNVDDKHPVDIRGMTPYHIAIRSNQLILTRFIMKTLDDKNPIFPDHPRGCTLLHGAAINGYLDMCELLIDNTEDKNPMDNKGWTPLHFAAREGHFEICQLIARPLKDKNPMTNDGTTPKQLMNTHIRNLNKNANKLFQ
jgi:ankyrin repeat protein